MIGWGGGITRAIPALALRVRCATRSLMKIRSRRIFQTPAELRSTGLLLPSPAVSHKKSHREGGFFYDWLGGRDSNPRWRSQSPQSYH